MKLKPNDRQLSMRKRHERAIGRPGSGLQTFRQPGAFDHQRMVAASDDRACQIGKHALAIVVDFGRSPVDGFGRSHDLCAKRRADRLISSAVIASFRTTRVFWPNRSK